MNFYDFDQPGGRPRDVNDPFQWEQDSIREAFKGVFSMCGVTAPEGVILSGCMLSAPATSSTDITEGFVYLEGEIFHVEAAAGVTKDPADDWVFKIIQDDNGVSIGYATGAVETLMTRKVELSSEPPATSSDFMPHDAQTFAELMNGLWVKDSSSTHWSASSGGLSTSGEYVMVKFNALTETLDIQAFATDISVTGTPIEINFSLHGFTIGDFDVRVDPFYTVGTFVGTELCKVNGVNGQDHVSISRVGGGNFASGSHGAIMLRMSIPVTKV